MPESLSRKVDPEVYRVFRSAVYLKKGLKYGSIKQSLEEAMLMYAERHLPNKNEIERIRAKIGIKEPLMQV